MNLTILVQLVVLALFFMAAPACLVFVSKRIRGIEKTIWMGIALVCSWLGYLAFVLAFRKAERR